MYENDDRFKLRKYGQIDHALSSDEVQEMKRKASEDLTPVQLEEFGKILTKFKKGTSLQDNINGLV